MVNFCEKCGTKIQEGARFCEKCGAPIEAEADNRQGGLSLKVGILIGGILLLIAVVLVVLFFFVFGGKKEDATHTNADTEFVQSNQEKEVGGGEELKIQPTDDADDIELQESDDTDDSTSQSINDTEDEEYQTTDEDEDLDENPEIEDVEPDYNEGQNYQTTYLYVDEVVQHSKDVFYGINNHINNYTVNGSASDLSKYYYKGNYIKKIVYYPGYCTDSDLKKYSLEFYYDDSQNLVFAFAYRKTKKTLKEYRAYYGTDGRLYRYIDASGKVHDYEGGLDIPYDSTELKFRLYSYGAF